MEILSTGEKIKSSRFYRKINKKKNIKKVAFHFHLKKVAFKILQSFF